MTRGERYRSVIKQLTAAGFSASMMRSEQLGFQDQARSEKSAWLTFYQEQWVMGTWSPCLYRLPAGIPLPEFCRAFVDDPSSMATVSDVLVARFGIVKVSDEERDVILEASPEPTYESITKNLVRRGFEVDRTGVTSLMVFGYENGDGQESRRCVAVCEYEEFWHLMTMGPYAYRLPIEESVEDVCAACVIAPDFDMFSIPEDLVIKHWLVRLPHEEWEKIDASFEEFEDGD